MKKTIIAVAVTQNSDEPNLLAFSYLYREVRTPEYQYFFSAGESLSSPL
ncbi:hypothetical protein [Sphingobacterium sp. CZ-UAM]|nr:hypothetical protein [Sphingobacterium sp. CZ-UAM]